MILDTTIVRLRHCSRMPESYQLAHKSEIVELFRDFWKKLPSEEIFGEVISGLIIFPEILYIMVNKGC